jgi:hypothetical protein
MNKILRKVFFEVTSISKMGVSTLKTKGIKAVSFDELIPNFTELLEEKGNVTLPNPPKPNPELIPLAYQRPSREYDVKTIKGRF